MTPPLVFTDLKYPGLIKRVKIGFNLNLKSQLDIFSCEDKFIHVSLINLRMYQN